MTGPVITLTLPDRLSLMLSLCDEGALSVMGVRDHDTSMVATAEFMCDIAVPVFADGYVRRLLAGQKSLSQPVPGRGTVPTEKDQAGGWG